MSTKTIAVNTQVYSRLARAKRDGESFSRTLARMLDQHDKGHTGADILAALATMPGLPPEHADAMLATVRDNRATEKWLPHD